MFQLTDPICDARLLQLQDRLQELEAKRRVRAAQPVPIASRKSIGALARLVSLLGTLAQDSRDKLRTKEQDLAGWGVSWTQDPSQDEALAMELQAARALRQVSAALPVVPAPAAPSRRLRWVIGSALARAAARMERLPGPVTAD